MRGRGERRRAGQRFLVERELGGLRLEEVIGRIRPELSRSAIARLIKRGGVRVNGELLRKSGLRLHIGAQLEVDWEAGHQRSAAEKPSSQTNSQNKSPYGRDYAGPLREEPAGAKKPPSIGGDRKPTDSEPPAEPDGTGRAAPLVEPQIQNKSVVDTCLESGEPAHRLLPGLDPLLLADLVEAAAQLDVIYSDDDIVVVNKPAGMLTHGTEKHQHGSLAELARLRFGRMPLIMGDDRPGIVHRLDRETSGAIVLARTPEAMDDLREQFRNREVEKVYLAIVHRNAEFETAVLNWDLAQKGGDTDRQEYLDIGQGKEAVTEVNVEERFGHTTLVSCVPRTGRRHQIRVHLYAAGLPIVGDALYGGRRGPQLPEGAPRLRRHALHAVELTLRHPTTGEILGFGAEIPSDMENLLDWLRGM